MDKLLKSPNSTYTGCDELTGEALVAIAEVLVPRVGATVLGGTPIAVTYKTANNGSCFPRWDTQLSPEQFE